MPLNEHSLEHQGRSRGFLLHLPEAPAGSAGGAAPGGPPWPLVIAFHGGGSTALALQQTCGLTAKADAAGFVVAFPEGSAPEHSRRRSWNAGGVGNYAAQQQVDDVGFTLALVEAVAQQVVIDRRRVYVTGFSNGAMMAYRVAAELAGQIAACAAVGGTMALADPRPAQPVPILHIHGTADHFANFAGGQGRWSSGDFQHQPVEECVQVWARLNHCQSPPVVSTLPNRIEDGTTVERREYLPAPGRADAAATVLYVVHGGGHQWPGQLAIQDQLPPWLKLSQRMRDLGISSGNLDANELMWDFFQAHHRP